MSSHYSPQREATRLRIPVPVTLEWASETGAPVVEETTTENISRQGASVFSALPLGEGRYLRVTSSVYNVSLVAYVRDRTTTADGRARLHLQFLHQEWPLDVI